MKQQTKDKIDNAVAQGLYDNADAVIEVAVDLLLASKLDQANALAEALQDLFKSDLPTLAWSKGLKTTSMDSDTTAGMIVLTIARQALDFPPATAGGTTRRLLPGSKRKFLQQHGISTSMSARICGAAGRLAAHPLVSEKLRTGDVSEVLSALDMTLRDGRTGQMTLRRLDRVGKP